jgi:hypothetical protein
MPGVLNLKDIYELIDDCLTNGSIAQQDGIG